MVQSNASSVQEYLDNLAPERRQVVEAVRSVILQNLPPGYEEGVQYGMISYYVPLSHYPNTYNKQPLSYVALASQKNYLSLYLMGLYADAETGAWFDSEYKKSGKKLNMGKSCVRFKKSEDLPLDLIGRVIAMTSIEDFIARYERSRSK